MFPFIPLQYFYVRHVFSYFRVRPFSAGFWFISFSLSAQLCTSSQGFSAYRIFSFDCNFSCQFFVSCAWSSLQFNVWVFARPSVSSLSRYRLVSISFVSFAFLDCLIAFVQFVGCFILTLYLFNCYFSVPLYFTSLRFACFPSPVVKVLK